MRIFTSQSNKTVWFTNISIECVLIINEQKNLYALKWNRAMLLDVYLYDNIITPKYKILKVILRQNLFLCCLTPFSKYSCLKYRHSFMETSWSINSCYTCIITVCGSNGLRNCMVIYAWAWIFEATWHLFTWWLSVSVDSRKY